MTYTVPFTNVSILGYMESQILLAENQKSIFSCQLLSSKLFLLTLWKAHVCVWSKCPMVLSLLQHTVRLLGSCAPSNTPTPLQWLLFTVLCRYGVHAHHYMCLIWRWIKPHLTLVVSSVERSRFVQWWRYQAQQSLFVDAEEGQEQLWCEISAHGHVKAGASPDLLYCISSCLVLRLWTCLL